MINTKNYSYNVIEDTNRIKFEFVPKNNANKLLGEVVLLRCYDDVFETHADIYETTLKGCGFGIYMYSSVIEWCFLRGYKVISSDIERQSSDALRLWGSKRLRNKFSISLNEDKSRWMIWNLQGQN